MEKIINLTQITLRIFKHYFYLKISQDTKQHLNMTSRMKIITVKNK